MYIDFNKEDLKSKVGENVRISKDEQIFAKGHVPSRSEEAFILQKVKSTVPWAHVISDLNDGRKSMESFTKKNCKKQIKKCFELKK